MQLKPSVRIEAAQLGVARPAVQQQRCRESKLVLTANALKQNLPPLSALMLRVDDKAVQKPRRAAFRHSIPRSNLWEPLRRHRLNKRAADDAAGDFQNKHLTALDPFMALLRRVACNLLGAASARQFFLRGVRDYQNGLPVGRGCTAHFEAIKHRLTAPRPACSRSRARSRCRWDGLRRPRFCGGGGGYTRPVL